ncbi:hypothetical protein RRG08_010474 [Elysia crispata]|uniref:Uncharacterized protein n=1 Tax=Elysia crispata TaxID=231223 RepID=A0AAE1E2E2_9GAST|nr:hypothetical protein RRG08_010474 [Elysia crispata]
MFTVEYDRQSLPVLSSCHEGSSKSGAWQSYSSTRYQPQTLAIIVDTAFTGLQRDFGQRSIARKLSLPDTTLPKVDTYNSFVFKVYQIEAVVLMKTS